METIDRTYRVRDKQVHLRELTDVVAVRSTSAGDRGMVAPETLKRIAPKADLSQIRALERSGWTLVPRERATDGAKVYLKSGDRVVLGTNRVTALVSPNYSEEEAKSLLERQGLQVVQRLKFAPNLFVATIPDDVDPLKEVLRLSSLDGVEFAEPEMIESIGGR